MNEFRFPLVGLGDDGKGTGSGGGFAGINDGGIFNGGGNVLGVVETTTT